MNWIKIQPDTKLPVNSYFLLRSQERNYWLADTMLGMLSVDEYGSYGEDDLQEFTHYAIIDEPAL